MVKQLSVLCGEGCVAWKTMDDATITTDVANDDWEAALVAKARGEVDEGSDDDNDDDNEPEDHQLCTECKRCSNARGCKDSARLVARTCHRQAVLAEQNNIIDIFEWQRLAVV